MTERQCSGGECSGLLSDEKPVSHDAWIAACSSATTAASSFPTLFRL